ncbi:hypothetical protein PRVXH_000951 [Proteinivorax hydrogeniformans]|uniref:Uncharacterized protein n=1 Tax=Proteinivorax hydrogeniformans TaxID=1826727 RepID=A0AAU8HW77_9FIRM
MKEVKVKELEKFMREYEGDDYKQKIFQGLIRTRSISGIKGLINSMLKEKDYSELGTKEVENVINVFRKELDKQRQAKDNATSDEMKKLTALTKENNTEIFNLKKEISELKELLAMFIK